MSSTEPAYKTFDTGAIREAKDGKGDYSLLPPFAEHKLAQLMADNADRVPPRNWEKGIPLSSFIDSGRRHINQYMMGMDDEYHLLKAAWNLMCAVDTIERVKKGMLPSDLIDVGAYQGKWRIEYADTTGEALKRLSEWSPSLHDTVVPMQSMKTPEHCPAYRENDCEKEPCADCVLAVVE